MAVSGWIKFIKYPAGAGVMTGIVGLGLVYLAATILQWLTHLVRASKTKAQVLLPPAVVWTRTVRQSDHWVAQSLLLCNSLTATAECITENLNTCLSSCKKFYFRVLTASSGS